MLAARSGAVGGKIQDDSAKLRKYSVVSLGNKAPKSVAENGKGKRHSAAGQVQPRTGKTALLYELEMNWYLRVCELSYEYTVACRTGMPYR
ncbi:hypothetical protein GDO81_007527 [Engystomops pustulosus]|uniref:Uncharacterized protein n=2 Tax=Engystomops pustulosus TaxID=76066 RepID=A0AAV7C7Q0_ENGPU|nr:hypothetical protein GDO81_007527 [Engystomops pustulosus]